MTFINQLKEDLKKLARLGANISESHTCAIFLPTELLMESSSGVARGSEQSTASIELVAMHSLSTTLTRDCRLQIGSGLIGWVAQHGRPIHVAPFDLDSATLGIYTESEPIKSLVAVPITMPTEASDARKSAPPCAGVLMCDSRKAFSFTKLQIKHLEDVATQISRLLYWGLFKKQSTSVESSWESFCLKLAQLGDALGSDSVEVLRISVDTFSQVEHEHGISIAVQQSEQFVRLAQQALPPHFPLVRVPNGDILVALDNMMSSFFQHKLRTLASHLSTEAKPFAVSVLSFPARSGRGQGMDIDLILQQRPTANKTMSKASATKVVVGGGTRA